MDVDEIKRANSARVQYKRHKKKIEEVVIEKPIKTHGRVTEVSGHYKQVPYKVNKHSKFITNCEKINQKLHHKVQQTIKKD